MTNNTEELEHRIRMIQDDLKVIVKFIKDNNLDEQFLKPTLYADHCWTHINNIEIACDLSDNESINWKFFETKN